MADTIISDSAERTRGIAEELASQLQPGTVLTLSGDLGAGKTHFVQGLARGLGYTGDVSSPTFALIQEYRGGRLSLFHIDFYRLETLQDIERLGVEEDYLETSGVTAIEWAEKFPQILPPNHWQVNISITSPTHREITITQNRPTP